MRIAILSDIHANLEALESVLRKIDGSAIDELWCLGDIVGYGADPLACIKLVQENCSLVIKGNHDDGAALQVTPTNFNRYAAIALDWTREQLDEDSLQWLRRLPLHAVRYGFLIFHSSLEYRNAYIFTQSDAELNIELMRRQYPDARGGFFGHSHSTFFFQGAAQAIPEPASIAVDTGKLFLCNPASVGQPRNLSPKAWFAIWDSETHTISFVAVSYAIGTAQKKILAAGLPEALAARLARGE